MKKGFTLIELLFYLAIFSIMLFISFQFIVAAHIRFMNINRNSNQKMYYYTACQAMSYALEKASSLKKNWKKNKDHELIFYDNDRDRDIGFAFDKNRFVKKTGVYNSGYGWQSHNITVLAEHVDSLHFQYDIIDGLIIGISWELVAKYREKNYTIKQYVCLRNRNNIT